MRDVEYGFSHRVYRLPFRVPLRTGHGNWTQREGVLVRLEKEDGEVGYGEAAPIPWFGTETVEAIDRACRTLGPKLTVQQLESVPASMGCLRNALSAARSGWLASPENTSARQLAALLPAGRAGLDALRTKLAAGFRVFKWKVGVGDVASELGLLDELCAEMPNGAKLRLDANGSWERRTAERWLERCAERPVEYVEQPCGASATASDLVHTKLVDLLLGLEADYPTPIALDESACLDGHVEAWIARGWPGYFVIKPSLLGDVDAVMRMLRKAEAKVVFSSALETAVGAKAAMTTAFGWTGSSHALGFGVWPLFASLALNGPMAAPFLRWEDVLALNSEAAWNALN